MYDMELTPKQQAKIIYDEFYLATKDSMDILKIKSKATALTCSSICVNKILATCPQKENEIFSDTVKEVMQSMVNQMFASSLAMIGQTQNPLQVTYPQQLYSSETALNSISSVTEKTQAAEVKDLEADNCKSMDDDTRNALGSLFDDED